MKLMIALFAVLMTSSAFAGKLEAVDCMREQMAAGLSEVVKASTSESLNSSTFEIEDYNYADWSNDEIVVSVIVTSRADSSKVYLSAATKVEDVKTCKVSARLLVD